MVQEKWKNHTIYEKEKLFTSLLQHKHIKSIHAVGLMMAVAFENFEINKKIINLLIAEAGINKVGVFTDWFLFADNCLRIVPPLVISEKEISEACALIHKILDNLT